MKYDSNSLEFTAHKIISSITLSSFVKGSILASILAFLTPLWGFLLLIFGLTMGDLITGTLAANKRGEKIHSKGIGRTVYKFAVYFIVILSSAGIEKVFASGVPFVESHHPITWAIAGTICLRELKSIFENAESYTGAPLISRINLFEKLFNSKNDSK